MTVQQTIAAKIRAALAPSHLEVIDESHMHRVPPGAQSHFRVVVVADAFRGQGRIARHQAINALLAEELAGPVHALALQTHTADEWAARAGRIDASPQCLGGGKAAGA